MRKTFGATAQASIRPCGSSMVTRLPDAFTVWAGAPSARAERPRIEDQTRKFFICLLDGSAGTENHPAATLQFVAVGGSRSLLHDLQSPIRCFRRATSRECSNTIWVSGFHRW